VDKNEAYRLVEKMARAKMRLEGHRRQHADHCPTEDPESLAPCNCGASDTNDTIDKAIKELSFDE